MNNKVKNILYSVLVVLVLVVIGYTRKSKTAPAKDSIAFMGETMGTTYQVKYHGFDDNLKEEVDSLLVDFNMSLSTYIPESEISRFNEGAVLKMQSEYFFEVLSVSKTVYAETNGAFDPTIMPLVRAWGFFRERSEELPDSTEVQEYLELVNFDSIFFDRESICKMKKDIQLDFSAIAKGYGVDVVFDFLRSRGIENLYVEIGGELRTSGLNNKGEKWKIGVEDPQVDELNRDLYQVIELSGKSMATSGNYRNFYIKDGVKYAHTLSPYTGYPVEHSLLSATVISDACIQADAYATAFMVLGVEKSREILDKHPELEAFLIYSDENGELQTYKTSGINLIEHGT